MVLVAAGSPLDWNDSQKYIDWIKSAGVEQFIHFYQQLTSRTLGKPLEILRWGDEIEGIMVEFDHENKQVRLLLESDQKLKQVKELGLDKLYTLEYANYMIECVPLAPYKGLINHLNTVETNMRTRRSQFMQLLKPNQFYLFYPTFPRLGCPNSTLPDTSPSYEDNNDVSKSVFVSDKVIYPGHPRFRTLSANIRKRRGSKVAIQLPIFKDKNTPSPFMEQGIPTWDEGDSQRSALPDHVLGDAMVFGMGSCCLQITFQANNVSEACKLYDQLATLTPILMALSASTPIFRGYLVDEDCRWKIICQACDDRNAEERGEKECSEGVVKLPKSRYSSIDLYISERGQKFNDVPVVKNEKARERLLEAGVPENISDHVSHLFVRDPVAVYEEQVTGEAAKPEEYLKHTNHFENINSTYWQSMRFKLPPAGSNIGWRVEFRSLDVQATEFENAAFSIFVVLLSRVILTYDLNLLLPMSKLEENFSRASKRNAVRDGKFWFVDSLKCDAGKCCYFLEGEDENEAAINGEMKCPLQKEKCCYREMDINTIMNGKDGFKGLIPMLTDYLNGMEDIDIFTRCSLTTYFSLLSKRASGELLTWASWMRNFVQSHPEYKQDSVVSDRITYDLVWRHTQIAMGQIEDPTILFKLTNKTQSDLTKAQKEAQQRLPGCDCNNP